MSWTKCAVIELVKCRRQEKKTLIELNPRFTTHWLNRGAIHYWQGEVEMALCYYSRALELNPRDAKAWNNRGNAWLLKSEVERGLSDVNHALTLDPQSAEAWALRGAVWVLKQGVHSSNCGLRRSPEAQIAPDCCLRESRPCVADARQVGRSGS